MASAKEEAPSETRHRGEAQEQSTETFLYTDTESDHPPTDSDAVAASSRLANSNEDTTNLGFNKEDFNVLNETLSCASKIFFTIHQVLRHLGRQHYFKVVLRQISINMDVDMKALIGGQFDAIQANDQGVKRHRSKSF